MPAHKGNNYASRGKRLKDELWRAVARDDYQALRRGCEAIARNVEAGDMASMQFLFDRIIGRAMPELPDIGQDRAFAITWSFGPQAIDIAGESAEQAALPSAERSSEQQP